jgi:uncharacterized protein YcfJ
MAIRGVQTRGITNAFSNLIAAQQQQWLMEQQRKLEAERRERAEEERKEARKKQKLTDDYRTGGTIAGAVIGGYFGGPAGAAAGAGIGSTVGGKLAEQQGGERVSSQEVAQATVTGATAFQQGRQREENKEQVFSDYGTKKQTLQSQRQETLSNVETDADKKSVNAQYDRYDKQLDSLVLTPEGEQRDITQSSGYYQQQFNQIGPPTSEQVIGPGGERYGVVTTPTKPGAQRKIEKQETISPVIMALRDRAEAQLNRGDTTDRRVAGLEGVGVTGAEPQQQIIKKDEVQEAKSASLNDFLQDKTRQNLIGATAQARTQQDINSIDTQRSRIAQSAAQNYLTEGFVEMKDLDKKGQINKIEELEGNLSTFRLENKDKISPVESAQFNTAFKQLRARKIRLSDEVLRAEQRASLRTESVAGLNKELRNSLIVRAGKKDIDYNNADLIIKEADSRGIRLSKASLKAYNTKRSRTVDGVVEAYKKGNAEQKLATSSSIDRARNLTDDMRNDIQKRITKLKPEELAVAPTPATERRETEREDFLRPEAVKSAVSASKKSRTPKDKASSISALETLKTDDSTFKGQKANAEIEAAELRLGSTGQKDIKNAKEMENRLKKAKDKDDISRIMGDKKYASLRGKLDKYKTINAAIETSRKPVTAAKLRNLTNKDLEGRELQERIETIFIEEQLQERRQPFLPIFRQR